MKIVENLKHRAGKDAEGKTGDGVGILLQISHKFFAKAAKQLGIELGGERDYGVGMFFFPQDELQRNQCQEDVRGHCRTKKEWNSSAGVKCRPTPTKLGQKAVDCMPYIMQGICEDVRRMWKRDWRLTASFMLRDVSLSSLTMIPMWFPFPAVRSYIRECFLVESAAYCFSQICRDEGLRIRHCHGALPFLHEHESRAGRRAHPNRFIVHNGEINTIRGNADKMLAREETMESEHLKRRAAESTAGYQQ